MACAINRVDALSGLRGPMKLTDPSAWPPGFGPIRFGRLDTHSARSEILIFRADGWVVAELNSLHEDDGALALDPNKETVLPLARCWSLHVLDGEGRVSETHVLCPGAGLAIDLGAGADTSERRELTDALQVWATLTLLRAFAPDDRRR